MELIKMTVDSDDYTRDLTIIYRSLTINNMGIWVDVPDKWWLVDD